MSIMLIRKPGCTHRDNKMGTLGQPLTLGLLRLSIFDKSHNRDLSFFDESHNRDLSSKNSLNNNAKM